MEGAPEIIDPREVALDLGRTVPGVAGIGHVWSITEDRRVATLEAVLTPSADPEAGCAHIKARLSRRFSIGHAIVETASAGNAPAEVYALTARRAAPSPASP